MRRCQPDRPRGRVLPWASTPEDRQSVLPVPMRCSVVLVLAAMFLVGGRGVGGRGASRGACNLSGLEIWVSDGPFLAVAAAEFDREATLNRVAFFEAKIRPATACSLASSTARPTRWRQPWWRRRSTCTTATRRFCGCVAATTGSRMCLGMSSSTSSRSETVASGQGSLIKATASIALEPGTRLVSSVSFTLATGWAVAGKIASSDPIVFGA